MRAPAMIFRSLTWKARLSQSNSEKADWFRQKAKL